MAISFIVAMVWVGMVCGSAFAGIQVCVPCHCLGSSLHQVFDNILRKPYTVNLAGPVFHLFSSGNPDFIIYMDELRVDEIGMIFHLQCSKHLRYDFHIQYISTFYAMLVWWNNIP
jgi:hypothetical protein